MMRSSGVLDQHFSLVFSECHMFATRLPYSCSYGDVQRVNLQQMDRPDSQKADNSAIPSLKKGVVNLADPAFQSFAFEHQSTFLPSVSIGSRSRSEWLPPAAPEGATLGTADVVSPNVVTPDVIAPPPNIAPAPNVETHSVNAPVVSTFILMPPAEPKRAGTPDSLQLTDSRFGPPLTLTDLYELGKQKAASINTDGAMLAGIVLKINSEGWANQLEKKQSRLSRDGVRGLSALPLGALSGYSLYSDANSLMDSKTRADSFYYAAASALDATAFVGSPMMAIPPLRKLGTSVAGISFASRAALGLGHNLLEVIANDLQ
jgi:hypothetical protein